MSKTTYVAGVVMSCAVLYIAAPMFAENPTAPAGKQNPQPANPVGAGADSIGKCPVLGAPAGAQQPMPAGAQQPHFVSTLYQRHARDRGAAPG